MSLKQFDYKRFLLEKGERVGLGVAVTVMGLMLVFSLFMPSKGFFSGSPVTRAKELTRDTEQLENALRAGQPSEGDLPDNREGKLIAFDNSYLRSDHYATQPWFEPIMKYNKARRPPKIYNMEEAVAAVAAVPVDTYLFRFDRNPPTIAILESEYGSKTSSPGGTGAFNPFQLLAKGNKGTPGSSREGGFVKSPFLQTPQMRQLPSNNPNLNRMRSLLGDAENAEYYLRWISVEDWRPQQRTARQPVPLRMAIIAGSFPYKKQLQEHKTKLRLRSVDEVLGDTIGEGTDRKAAFDFLGVEVQRMETDADGKSLTDWENLPLREAYQVWLNNTYLPFEPEDSKYDLVKPNDGKGLVMPLLREFHAGESDTPGLPFLQGLMMQFRGGQVPGQSSNLRAQMDTPSYQPKTRYPDVAADLPKIRETLNQLKDLEPKQIAAPRFVQPEFLDPFNPTAAASASNTTSMTVMASSSNNEQEVVPEYVLARVVDVTIQPGKYYRYRFKVKMVNPNYQRSDAASPAYKEKLSLESAEWYELQQIVKVPDEMFYYVVDEAQSMTRREQNALPRDSAQYRAYHSLNTYSSSDQVVFQFHRWVESTLPNRQETDPIAVGEWAVAERVFVARGEYVGRKVNVDLPIWQYVQNKFILPAENWRPSRRTGKVNTGIEVDFGQDPLENNTILVDFEGGHVSASSPLGDNKTVFDDCAIEVLMLSGDGKLLARTSAKDTDDTDRIERRAEVLKRIQQVREGRGVE
ncbi:MAG TPA: hypothetical protein VH592_00580 [Gemmataceae bacterium]|jgi:hypothetical protein